jgi:CRP-like cAMP-binding protein
MGDQALSRFVRRLLLNSALSQQACEAVTVLPWRVMKRPKLSYVLREGDRIQEVSVLVEGFAQRQKHTSEGTRQIVSFGVAGDPLDFDCLFLGEPDFSVQMCTAGTIACVRSEAINALIDHRPEVGRAITASLLADAAIFQEWVVNTGRRDARQRIAHLLCEILVRVRAQGIYSGAFELPFTQEQIADATGLTSVHVNRILRQLTSEGAIYRDGRMISIPNWDLLQEIGDFDPRFLHMREDLQPALPLG